VQFSFCAHTFIESLQGRVVMACGIRGLELHMPEEAPSARDRVFAAHGVAVTGDGRKTREICGLFCWAHQWITVNPGVKLGEIAV